MGFGELRGVGGGKQRLVDAEHLREFQRAALEPAEGLVHGERVFVLQRLGVGRPAHGAFPVVLEVIDAHPHAGPREGGHPAQARGLNRVLLAQAALPSRQGMRNLARSRAESKTWVRRRSKATATVFSMNASVRS